MNPPWRKHRRQSSGEGGPGRAERLLEERAVPGRRVEDARRAVAVADARVTAARARLAQREEVLASGGGTASGNAFILRAPIAGRVAEVFAALGASCIRRGRRSSASSGATVELQAGTPKRNRPLHALDGDRVRNSRTGRCHRAEADHVHDAGVIDPRTRALPLQIEVENRNGQLLVGQIVIAVLYTGRTQRIAVVPQEAVLMEAGRPDVFVQVGGERFARRFVDVASRDAGLVGVRAGVASGDRVVTWRAKFNWLLRQKDCLQKATFLRPR